MTISNKPWIILTVGLPGSGKSTWISGTFVPYLAGQGAYAEVLSTDDIVDFVAKASAKTYSETFKDVIDHAQRIVDSRIYLSSIMGLNLIVDQSSLTVNSRKRKLDLLKDKDKYYKIALLFEEPHRIIYDRCKERNNTGKVIDAKVLADMIARFADVNTLEDFDDVLTVNEFKLKYMPKKEEHDDSTTINRQGTD